MEDTLKAKFIGCMLGNALGDAIGELAFRIPGKTRLRNEIGQVETLRYTDDTAMALGVAESLAELGRIDSENLGRTFHRNYIKEPWRGYASGPPTIFSLVKMTGISYKDAAARLFHGMGSFGNGAAMRAAPVGLFYHRASELYEHAVASAEVTHAHPIARDGAAVQAFAVARATELKPGETFPLEAFADALHRFARTPEIRKKMLLVRDLAMDDAPVEEAARVLGQSVAMHESMPFALFAFLKRPHSFEECLFCAVLNGGDRDTLGAMACSVSGAYLGANALPPEWTRKLENRDLLERLALTLLKRSQSVHP